MSYYLYLDLTRLKARTIKNTNKLNIIPYFTISKSFLSFKAKICGRSKPTWTLMLDRILVLLVNPLSYFSTGFFMPAKGRNKEPSSFHI